MQPAFFFISGALFALGGVVARSLSSHAIRPQLQRTGGLENFNLAADYLLIHGIALLVLSLCCHLFPQQIFSRPALLIFAGSLVFCSTVLAKSLIPLGPLGILTPIGGAILMAGWLYLAVTGFSLK